MTLIYEHIEKHTDGTIWIACTKASPKAARTWDCGEGITANVYHPDARDTDGGQDCHWVCPHCGGDWWEEIDG